MAVTVTHAKVSAIADDGDTTKVQPSDWNADHSLSGLGTLAEQDANDVAITGGSASGLDSLTISGTGQSVFGVGSTFTPLALFVSGSPLGVLAQDVNGVAGIEMRNKSSGNAADFRFIISDNIGGDYIAVGVPGTGNTAALFGLTRSTITTVFSNTLGGGVRALAIGTVNAGPLVFGTTNAERARIVAGGARLLIGTTTDDGAGAIQAVGTISTKSANGAGANIKNASTLLSAVSGATVTATNLIPANARLIGVTTRITTALGTGGGTTGYNVGDGSDADRFGVASAVTLGTTTNNPTADPTGWAAAARSVVITAVGGNFNGTGAIRVSADYIDQTPPTS